MRPNKQYINFQSFGSLLAFLNLRAAIIWMIKIKLYALLIFLSFSTCTFESDEEFYKEVEQPNAETITISLDSYSPTDTIYVFGPSEFNYSIDPGKSSLTTTRVLLGESQISWSPGYSLGSFRITYPMRSGVFPLKIEFVADSGTGSLADRIGVEQIVASRQWIVKIDVEPPVVPDLQFSTENGFLKLSWPPHHKPDFDRYYIVRKYKSEEEGFTILDKAENHWIDESYTGCTPEAVAYTLQVRSSNGLAEITKTKSDPFQVSYGAFNPLDSTVLVKWNTCRYPAAFKEYVIDGLTINQLQDTVRMLKLTKIRLGSPYSVDFVVKPESNFGSAFSRSFRKSFNVGLELPTGGHLYYNLTLKSFVQAKTNKLQLYDEHFQPTGEIGLNNNFHSNPYPGNIVYTSDIDKIYSTDLSTGESFSRFTGENTWVETTSVGVVSLVWSDRMFGKTTYYSRVERLRDNVRLFGESGSSHRRVNLSADGKYLSNTNNEILRLTGDKYVPVISAPSEKSFDRFRPDKSSEVFFADYRNVMVYECETGAFLRTHSNSELRYAMYDPYSRSILWAEDYAHKVVIQNVDTGVAQQFKVAYAQYSDVRLVNGYLMSSGFAMKVIQ